MTLLEAMAAELPVAAIAPAANSSVMADQQEGLLTPAGDAVALLTALGRFCKERDWAARWAAPANGSSASLLANMADQHLTWFEQLVG